ncbi:Sucrose nonfermenting 4-like protein [Camellia lanceoleosa]|uniref:Sucrose nonfermenting 4-like protein n=1 Tax=Camellia lanceoleosa TaxID=1840588 RepID=A0ACC0FE57_9ERIC|nr:Sucrose nonfermenting 4-like protein [Camellia lanceoleosa]
MFHSGVDYGKETGETVASTTLILTRFVWPYGGGSVFLCYSFQGETQMLMWSGHYPMTPVEGCPSDFRLFATYRSYHRHQPFENGNYGRVNTVFLARESDYVPGILNPQMHSGSNMDVRVSGGPLHEALPRVSEADLEVSRHHITIFLSTHMDIALDVDLLVTQAFHIPLSLSLSLMLKFIGYCWSFVGVLSALDFIMIVREEELETHTISAWKDAKSYLSRQIDGNGRLFPRQLVHAGPDENLKDVALKILQNNVATVPVIHSSSGNASIPQLLNLASLSGILKCICRYFKHSFGSLPMLQLPICAIPLAQVSSIPIVDDNDSLLNVYSRSDINALAKDKIYTHINLEEMTINQLGQEPYSPYGSSSQRSHMCLQSDPLHKVMERLANPGSVNNQPGIGVGILFYLDFEKPVGFIECVKCLRFSV